MMRAIRRWTSAELAQFPPDDGKRYEIIDGELFVHQPTVGHQIACFEIASALDQWSKASHRGQVIMAPGVIFDQLNDVAPDIVWISTERLTAGLDPAGHIHTTPELMVEVLSAGSANARRDRVAKLGLYARQSVGDYWIADWLKRRIEVYRHDGVHLSLVETLAGDDILTSPMLPGFQLRVGDLFANVPAGAEECADD